MNLEQRADNHLSDWSTAFGRNAIFTLTLIALGVSLYFQDLALGLPFDAIPLANRVASQPAIDKDDPRACQITQTHVKAKQQ